MPDQAAPPTQVGVFDRTGQSGWQSSRMMSTFQDERLGPHEVAIPLGVPGNEDLMRTGQGGETDARGIPIPGGQRLPGRKPTRDEVERAIKWAVANPHVIRPAEDYRGQPLGVVDGISVPKPPQASEK